VESILEVLRRDSRFYDHSGGGITLTGGEPLSQPEFSAALLEAAKGRHMHTALETSGFADWETMQSLLRHIDLLYFDLKHPDELVHQAWTGQSNAGILRNLWALRGEYAGDLVIRIPYVPGFNTAPDVVSEMLGIARRVPNLGRVEILPYHRLGLPKYAALGRACRVAELEPVEKGTLGHLRELGGALGVKVAIDAQ